MPKMKSHTGAVKRFRKTRKGKLLRGHAYAGHLMEGKSPQRRRRVGREEKVSAADRKRVRRMLGT
jgi:large subunit ribosomal protein L35